MNATRRNTVDAGHNPKHGCLDHHNGAHHPEGVNRRGIDDQGRNTAAP
ncbi:MAG: hypothetical protein M5U23_03280 [Acidimicrobiia bacterium]|nr:hypothetical protein [Acidimicrobiia bacterium]